MISTWKQTLSISTIKTWKSVETQKPVEYMLQGNYVQKKNIVI